jgi:phosphatidylglycerol lysyltransferase
MADRTSRRDEMVPDPPPSADEREAVRTLVRGHGWNATSFQVLEPGYRYLFVGSDACVAYVDTGSAWVAAGSPLAALDRMAAVTAAFVGAARAAGRRACLFATEERFTSIS